MFDTFRRSWELAKASWAVLMMDKELLWFPVLSGIVMIITMVIFFLPIAAVTGIFAVVTDSGNSDTGAILSVILLFVYYLLAYTVSIYFNVALVGAVMIRLDGGDPKLSDGIKVANERLGTIVTYAAISATVGTILQAIRDRGIIGEIVAGLFGMAWNFATFFVVPVLVVKNMGPLDAIKESTALLKKTWGEQVAGGFGIGAITGLIVFAVIIVGGILIALSVSLNSPALTFILILALLIAFIITVVISSALSGVFRTMVYRYAETGIVPDSMDIETIKGAFKPKVKKGIFG